MLHLTRLSDVQKELSAKHLECINESGAQGKGQSCTYKFGCHHQRDRTQSQETGWALALEIAGEENTNFWEQVLGHVCIWRFERGVEEASRRKLEGCDVMDSIREEFSGQRVVSGSDVAEKLSKMRETYPLNLGHGRCLKAWGKQFQPDLSGLMRE